MSTLTETISSAFSMDRQRARYASERVDTQGEETAAVLPTQPSEAVDEESAHQASQSEEGIVTQTSSEDEDDEDEETIAEDAAAEERTTLATATTGRTTVTLAELEEERELARRRSSACVLLAVFILFRLWISAISEGDFSLLLISLVGTSWTARWIRHNREREEELDRRIANYLENSDPNTTGMDRNDLRMLSFQAQLALAIMESQRQMMEGGYGHPDGAEAAPGVSDEVRASWDHFAYKEPVGTEKPAKGGYGSVPLENKKEGLEDGPHCSICLCEYENDDQLVKLPCSHVYHDECIGSWTSNHVKCPLCNYDLESAEGSNSTPDISIV